MPVPGLDAQRCRARNAKAARRGFNSFPVRLSTAPPGPIDTNDPETAKGLRIITARGKLPTNQAAAVAQVNKVRGETQPALTADKLWIVYLEAGNSNFIRKYFMHLGDSTLRNIARRATRSIAFMNSHRTGGLSTDAELPYGRSFAGRFEQALAPDGRSFSRTLMGVYMLRGARPNGDNGPSTDDLYEGIKAGTIFDVSLGISGGDDICDVCGYDMEERDEEGNMICVHVPGTRRRMTKDQIDAQTARGVPSGVASFTLEDGTANEVSPVFDGAVPGAGFRKALSLARSHQLSAEDLDEARLSFAPLLGRRDFRAAPNARGNTMHPKQKINQSALRRLLSAAGIEVDDGEDDEDTAPANDPPPKPAAAPSAPQAPAVNSRTSSDEDRFRALEEANQRLERQLTEEREERQKQAQAELRKTVLAQAENWADQQVRLGLAIPAERDELKALHAQAAMDDTNHPAPVAYLDATNTPKNGTRVQALTALWSKRGRHHFSEEAIAPRDVPTETEMSASNGPAPLVTLQPAPNGARGKSDPILDQMLAGNKAYHESNGTH